MKITLNFFDATFSKNQATIPYLRFQSRDQLNSLKDHNPETLFMRRREKLLFWGKDLPHVDGYQKYKKDDDPYLFSNVLAFSLLDQFYRDKPRVRINKKNHIYKIVFFDKDVSNGNYRGLELYKTYHLHFSPFYTSLDSAIGFTISTSITGRIAWSIQDFKSSGIHFEDLRYDEETGEVFPTTKAIYRLGHNFNYASNLKEELDKQNAIQKEYKEINQFVNTCFRNKIDEFNLPDGLKIIAINETTYDYNKSQKGIKIKTLPRPENYFYNGTYPKMKNNFHIRRKIGYHKPFTYDNFENKTINISIIYLRSLYQDVRIFFKHVQEELINTFKLKKELFKYTTYEIDSIALKSYQSQFSLIKNADLVVVIIDKAHEVLEPSKSPYYFCKSEFIKRGINTQEVQIQQIQQFLSDKQQNRANYTDHNITLNIYAKLGGMAWTIKPDAPKNELIFGIGATTDKDGQPVLGLTSIFRGDGKYILGKASSVTNMDDYRNTLEQVVTTAIESSIQDGTLNTDEVFYLVFHIFKPAGKNNEVEALRRVIDKFSNYSFEHAFIHIGKGHNYRFFTYEKNNSGKQFKLKRGFGQNLRGTFIQINRKRAFLGLQSNSSVFYKIDIHKDSSFIDLEYVTEQVYQFTEMSHTSYNIQGTPITIKYPNLMANFTEKFNEGNLIYLDEYNDPQKLDHRLRYNRQSLWRFLSDEKTKEI